MLKCIITVEIQSEKIDKMIKVADRVILNTNNEVVTKKCKKTVILVREQGEVVKTKKSDIRFFKDKIVYENPIRR